MTVQPSGESTYYESGSVKVTSSRFISGDVSYPLGQITSVSLKRKPPNTGCATWAMIGGVIVVLAGLATIGGDLGVTLGWLAFGAILVVGGWLLLKEAKDTYSVQITTAAGETNALASQDKDSITPVVDALNQAIIDRG